MKRFTLRLYWGDTVTINQFDDGRYACPVCGAVLIYPPYAYADAIDPDNPARDDFAVGSHYVCASCGTQFGDDDFPDHGEKPTEEIWAELRNQWLSQLADKTQARTQLKHIGIILP